MSPPAGPKGDGRFHLVLDPIERLSEILFGLIMALTFTGALSAATAGHEEVRTMIFGAIGCNLAWGLVDGVMYLLDALTERGVAVRTFERLRRTQDPAPHPDRE